MLEIEPGDGSGKTHGKSTGNCDLTSKIRDLMEFMWMFHRAGDLEHIRQDAGSTSTGLMPGEQVLWPFELVVMVHQQKNGDVLDVGDL